jgi:hypothetical protein
MTQVQIFGTAFKMCGHFYAPLFDERSATSILLVILGTDDGLARVVQRRIALQGRLVSYIGTCCLQKRIYSFLLFFSYAPTEYRKHAVCLHTVHTEYVKCGQRHKHELASLMVDHGPYQYQNGNNGSQLTSVPFAGVEQITQNLAHLCR